MKARCFSPHTRSILRVVEHRISPGYEKLKRLCQSFRWGLKLTPRLTTLEVLKEPEPKHLQGRLSRIPSVLWSTIRHYIWSFVLQSVKIIGLDVLSNYFQRRRGLTFYFKLLKTYRTDGTREPGYQNPLCTLTLKFTGVSSWLKVQRKRISYLSRKSCLEKNNEGCSNKKKKKFGLKK